MKRRLLFALLLIMILTAAYLAGTKDRPGIEPVLNISILKKPPYTERKPLSPLDFMGKPLPTPTAPNGTR